MMSLVFDIEILSLCCHVLLDWEAIKNAFWGTPGWLSQLRVQLLISAQVTISGSWGQAPIGLSAKWGVCLRILSLSLSLCPPPLMFLGACLLSLSPSLTSRALK